MLAGMDSKEAAKLGIYAGLKDQVINYCEQLDQKEEK